MPADPSRRAERRTDVEQAAPRQRGRNVDLRTALVLLSLLGIVPMLLFSVALLDAQWESRQEENRRDLQQATRILAMAVDRELLSSIRQLERVAEVPSLEPGTLRDFHQYLQRLTGQSKEWDNLVLADAQGHQLANAALPFGQTLPPREDGLHRRAADRGKPVVSDIYQSTLTLQPSVAVAVPIRRGDQTWALNARLSPQHLSEMVKLPLIREQALSTIFDSQGRVVARSRDFERFFGQAAPSESLLRIQQATTGATKGTTLEGHPVLAGWERLPNGWTVQIAVPLEVYDGPLWQSMAFAALAGLGLLGISLAGSFWLSRRIGRGVAEAAVDAALLADGKPLPPQRSPFRQLQSLFDALQQAGERLRTTSAERNKALQNQRAALSDLHAELRRRDEFLAMLAHELRNPLAPIVTAVRVLDRSERLGDDDRQLLQMIDRQTMQLRRLVDDLLDASRLASGKITLKCEPVSLTDTVRKLAEDIRREAESNGQTLVVETPEGQAMVMADPVRIRQVLDNLLSNALKFTGRGGTIRLALDDRHAGLAVVNVTDDGLGIDPGRLGELFKPFSQIDPGLARSQGGLGLGLATSRQLIDMHGGHVTAHSEGKGRGATFTVSLPTIKANADTRGTDLMTAALVEPDKRGRQWHQPPSGASDGDRPAARHAAVHLYSATNDGHAL
jgi:signal transduction histidine kinase